MLLTIVIVGVVAGEKRKSRGEVVEGGKTTSPPLRSVDPVIRSFLSAAYLNVSSASNNLPTVNSGLLDQPHTLGPTRYMYMRPGLS